MYYEEKLIDGVWHWRGTPTGAWVAMTTERLSFLLTETRNTLAARERDGVRYRWLVDATDIPDDVQAGIFLGSKEMTDAAIDAAIEREQEKS